MDYITKRINRDDLIRCLKETEPEYMALSEDERIIFRLENPGFPATKLYVGCDSEKRKVKGVWYADYTRVIVVHLGGKRGARIFGEIIRERDHDKSPKSPRMRLMTESYRCAELYLEYADILEQFDMEIHLDVNPNEKYNSSIVVKEASGYIQAMTNVVPMVKNTAWAASFAADRFSEIMHFPKAASSAE